MRFSKIQRQLPDEKQSRRYVRKRKRISNDWSHILIFLVMWQNTRISAKSSNTSALGIKKQQEKNEKRKD